jgi:hypothetical protein
VIADMMVVAFLVTGIAPGSSPTANGRLDWVERLEMEL